MNIINGTLDKRNEVLESWNLHGNPFRKDPPPEPELSRIFVGRQDEMRRAAFATYDIPRNVLVRGGYGMGKTTFIKKLLAELSSAKRVSFLTAYQPLIGDRPLDLFNTVLKALAFTGQQRRST